MHELLKNFLEENEVHNYRDVEIIDLNENGHMYEVRFKYDEGTMIREERVIVQLWDVLAHVYNSAVKKQKEFIINNDEKFNVTYDEFLNHRHWENTFTQEDLEKINKMKVGEEIEITSMANNNPLLIKRTK